MIVGDISRFRMTQADRYGAHFRSIAGQVTLAPVCASILRDTNSELRSDINGGLRARTKAQGNISDRRGKRQTMYAFLAAHRERVCTCHKQRPRIGRGMWVHPNPTRKIGQVHLFLPTFSIVVGNEESRALLRTGSSIQDL